MSDVLERVRWRDHSTEHGWSREVVDTVLLVDSVGYLAAETDDYLVLAESVIVNDDRALRWGCQTMILKNCIVERETIREGSPPNGYYPHPEDRSDPPY